METAIKILSQIDWEKVIAIAGTIGTAILSYSRNKHIRKQKEAVKELDRKDAVIEAQEREKELLKDNLYTTKLRTLKQVFDVRAFSKLETLIQNVYDNTVFDRVTIMFLMNGKVDFNFMTVIYDQSNKHHHIGSGTPYSKLPIDTTYRRMITGLPIGRAHWESSPYEIGEIGQYLEIENVKHIGWFKVKRLALDDYNDLLVYMSWASEQDGKLDWKEKRKLELVTSGRIIPLLEEILAVPNFKDAEDYLNEINTKDDRTTGDSL